MEQTISTLVAKYEHGRIGRRELIQSLVLLASATTTASAAAFEGNGIDHVSLTVADPRKSAEFYKNIFGFVEVRQDLAVNGQIRLGSRAGDRAVLAIVPGTPTGRIDHFAIGVSPFDETTIRRDLRERNIALAGPGLDLRDPDGVMVQISRSDPR